jgi:four helix bundle protein
MSNSQSVRIKTYDLEDRTALFGEKIIKFCKEISQDAITRPLITQLIRCAMSIGANYCEADDADSKKDFRHKIAIVKKECRESKHFIRMVVAAVPELNQEAKPLWQEAKELHLIFNSIYKKVK